MTDKFEIKINEAQDAFDAVIDKIADEYRSEVIIPLCIKYELEFVSGMGTFFFVTKEDENINEDDAWSDGARAAILQGRMGESLREIFNQLNVEISHNQCFGYRVEDVNKETCTEIVKYGKGNVMKVEIFYSDGSYAYRVIDDGKELDKLIDNGRTVVEVPDSTVAMWEAVEKLVEVMQKQLLKLDNDAYDKLG